MTGDPLRDETGRFAITAQPEPPEPEPQPPRGKLIPAGPQSTELPDTDLIRVALARLHRH
jgi:hypothetical protein